MSPEDFQTTAIPNLERLLTDEMLGVHHDSNGQTMLPDDTCMSCCTNCARLVVSLLNRGELWGFWSDENPTAETGSFADGHDFAVIDGRWIIDIWSKLFSGIADKAVFDLQSAEQRVEIHSLFGNPRSWDRLPET